ncbi:uncharacterized protein EDB91DRAFT_1254344 [Suillus paluster]|uniref:uncharacterized protein n=1 Tax=Suillus paluster TaxID=48578 RepID=UPI001B868A80|nr:uncharacterized protein EDB91DRAFT_1254344 [Suillus paluster]KAG1726441.1 hypothetical protein EDB91DRAFT_1254344 [Suillus paluster]
MAQLPAFDCAPAKSKAATKPRKSASGASTRGRKKAVSSRVRQPVTGTSRQISPSSQQVPMVLSHQLPLQASYYPPPLSMGPSLQAQHPPPLPSAISYHNAGHRGAQNMHAVSPVHPARTAQFPSSQPPLAMHQPHTNSGVHLMQAVVEHLYPQAATTQQPHYLSQTMPTTQAGLQAGLMQHTTSQHLSLPHTHVHAQMYHIRQQQAQMAHAHMQAFHTHVQSQSQAQYPPYFLDYSAYPRRA